MNFKLIFILSILLIIILLSIFCLMKISSISDKREELWEKEKRKK